MRFVLSVLLFSVLLSAAVAQEKETKKEKTEVARESFTITFKAHAAPGATALVELQEMMHSKVTIVGALEKKVLENNEEKQKTLYKYRETILEMPKDGKEPTKVRRQYETAQREGDGKKSVLPFEGKTVLIEKKKDGYRFSVEGGGELTGKDAEPLADEFQSARGAGGDFTALLPADTAMRVDEPRDVDPKVLRIHFGKLAGITFDLPKSKGTVKLMRVYKNNGRQFGVVEVRIDLPLQEMSSSPAADPKAAEKLVMRPGAMMSLRGSIDGCIDGSVAIAVSTFDMEIKGTAVVTSPDAPAIEMNLAIKTSTKASVQENAPPLP